MGEEEDTSNLHTRLQKRLAWGQGLPLAQNHDSSSVPVAAASVPVVVAAAVMAKTKHTKKKPVAKKKGTKATPSVKKHAPKPAAAKNETASSRPRNFAKEEDVLICRTFVSTSEDPVKRNDQRATLFWSSIHTMFTALYHEEREDCNTVKNRFQHHISKDLQVWN